MHFRQLQNMLALTKGFKMCLITYDTGMLDVSEVKLDESESTVLFKTDAGILDVSLSALDLNIARPHLYGMRIYSQGMFYIHHLTPLTYTSMTLLILTDSFPVVTLTHTRGTSLVYMHTREALNNKLQYPEDGEVFIADPAIQPEELDKIYKQIV